MCRARRVLTARSPSTGRSAFSTARLGIARRRQSLGDDRRAVLTDQQHVGKSSADIDANSVHRNFVQGFKVQVQVVPRILTSDVEPLNLEP